LPPRIIGYDSFRHLIVCWGSNFHCVKEAMQLLDRADIAMLHVPQLYPLHPVTETLLLRARNIVVVENNATAQFAKLLKLHAGVTVNQSILKYNGMPFSVEELVTRLRALPEYKD
jgi:2-oxoglutarate ferredoxin oxidoreductase subunit alpha